MWVLFDLNGTLVDPSVLVEPGEIGVAALDEANMMAMVTVLAGAEATFKPLLDAALRRGLERAGRDPSLASDALVAPAVDARLPGRAGCARRSCAPAASSSPCSPSRPSTPPRPSCPTPASATTSSSCSPPRTSGAFKPEDLAYRYALERAGATDAWFVAGHWWDVAGAAYAGLRTAWISRTDLAYPIAMPPPDVRGADLADGGGQATT